MKSLINAMNTFGDGEEEGTFNPEEYFSFGEHKASQYENPFSQDNIEKVGVELKEESKGGAQSINLGVVESVTLPDSENSVPDVFETDSIESLSEQSSKGVDFSKHLNKETEPQLEVRTVSKNNRFNSFESTSEIESPTIQFTIEDSEDTISYEDTIKPKETTQEPELEIELDPEFLDDFSELDKIAELQDSNEVARMMDSSRVEKKVLTEEITFSIDEDDDEDLNIHIDSENDRTYNFGDEQSYEPKETSLTEQTKHTETTSEVKHITTSNHTEFTMYESKFGPKYRVIEEPKETDTMINLNKFKDGSEVIGDAYIERASVATYGENKKRVDYNLLIAGGVKIKASQFNAPPSIANDDVARLIGKVLKLEAKWNTYQRKEQLVVNGLTETNDTKVEDFIVADSLEIYEDLYYKLLGKIRKPWVTMLIESVMVDGGFLDKIKSTPAGLSNHDTGESGLFLHKVKVTMVAYQTSLLYPTVDSDVIIASGLLHDIGKVYEIGANSYTDIGITTGHISIGYNYVRESVNNMVSRGITVDEKTVLNILHCILSHHGKLEYGSPVTPKTREAWIIHLSDMVDTNVTHIDETLTGNKPRAYSTMLKHEVLDLNIF